MYSHYRVAAVMPLHYGKDFVADAIKSVADIVDEYHIMYSPVPCHGVAVSNIPNPDSRDDLYNAVIASGQGKRCYWHEHSNYKSEGDQVERGAAIASTCAIYIKLDADEVWSKGLLDQALYYGLGLMRHELRIPMIHYWRSLRRAVAHDPAAPGRVYFKMFPDGGEDTYSGGLIHHYGYALPSAVVRYKMSIHGHGHQFRTDVDWYHEIFMRNRQTDVHPVGSEYWNVEPVDLLPLMENHPFSDLEVIP